MAFGKQNNNGQDGKKGNGVGAYIALAFFVVAIIAGIVSSIIVFVAKSHPVAISGEQFPTISRGDYVEGRVHLATKELFSYKHSINFIPAGTEHYYIISDDDNETYYVVRATEDWVLNFTSDYANDPEGQLISGYVRRTDYEVKKAFVGYGIEDVTFRTDVYIDLLGVRYASFMLLGIFGLGISAVFGLLFVKYNNEPAYSGEVYSALGQALRSFTRSKAGVIVVTIIFMGSLVLLIHVMEML